MKFGHGSQKGSGGFEVLFELFDVGLDIVFGLLEDIF